jgi:hypothetical protein
MKVKLTDEQWQKILPILKSFPEIRLGAGRDVRKFRCAMAIASEVLRKLELGLQTL